MDGLCGLDGRHVAGLAPAKKIGYPGHPFATRAASGTAFALVSADNIPAGKFSRAVGGARRAQRECSGNESQAGREVNLMLARFPLGT